MGSGTNFAREPLFLYWDNDEKASDDADRDGPEKAAPSGDAKVDFRLMRMRLNGDDDKVFQNFTSGGIYFDMSQQQAAAQVVGFELDHHPGNADLRGPIPQQIRRQGRRGREPGRRGQQ